MVAVKRDEQRRLVLREDMETEIDATYDFRPMLDADADEPDRLVRRPRATDR